MKGQNVFNDGIVDPMKARRQHADLCRRLGCPTIQLLEDLPDVVFLANAGLVLPRLPEKVILMSHMKYYSRQRETMPLARVCQSLGFITEFFPETEVFEGQGEARWFHDGHLLVVGYGFRSTPRSVTVLRRVLGKIYRWYGVVAPRVVGVHLESPYLYHLDMAMLVVHATHAIVHEIAFSNATLRLLRTYMKVSVVRVPDPFALNAIATPTHLYVHALDPDVRKLLQQLTGLDIVENNVSEFEKAGGSVRCMILDV